MNYKLAKQLKDVGFPQYPEDDGLPGKAVFWKGIYVIEENIKLYIPTLSELIEACGDSFNFLRHVREDGETIPSLVGDNETLIWEASCWEKSVMANTPEEAVALLWLELNK